MKRLLLAAALAACTLFAASNEAQAQVVRPQAFAGITVGGLHFNAFAGLNQRYVRAGQAWVNEPYVYWRRVPDVTTGKVHVVPQVGYVRRLVWLYLDTWTGSYFYQDSMGNIVPYQPLRW